MIQWLLHLLGIPPAISAARRRSLIERLQDPKSDENATMLRAQRALERHRKREEAIAVHQAAIAHEKAGVAAERRGHQSEIADSTISLDRVRRKTDRVLGSHLAEIRRRNVVDPNRFMAAELIRKEAERRRLEG